MKHNKGLLLVMLLALSSCTMMGIDVNKAPESYTPDRDIFASESSSELDSSSHESHVSSQSTSTSTGPIMNGLTFEEAAPIIEHIKANINAADYVPARFYTSKFKSNSILVDKDSNPSVTIENIDSYIDFDDYVYSSKDKKVVNGNIDKNVTNYIYKENNVESKLFYSVTKDITNSETPVNNYSTSEAVSLEKADLTAKFTELTKTREDANQDLTNLAIEAMLGLKYVKNFFKKVDITSSNENSIAFDIEYDDTLLTKMTTRIIVNILNNKLMKFRTETHPIGVAVNVNFNEYDINYDKKTFTYPNLTGFEKI